MRQKLPTTEQRSKIMSKIRGKGTKLEEKVTKALWWRGIRFRKNVKGLRGTPDIAIKKYKIVIFIDSCFWHACEIHGNRPKKNVDFWNKKLDRNIERDMEVSEYYHKKEWHILRVWEHELKKDTFPETIERIYDFIRDAQIKET
ncbi:very short patch repair endonuclease [Metabacillus sp. KIGAM252]|uniref:Very short patch repair endonuclease n=1 Tax=Metabacillus flavus TaxID=2823519 RepID=A0ABS5LIE1_9BACI|nr:very short patch repair endonuclease [Metabacillus flavus]MBS2970386.1 very short patch repair endonuclease [Metabacillus flavus]